MKEIFSRFDKIEPVKQPVNDPSTTNGLSRSSQQNSYHELSIHHGISNGLVSPIHHPNPEPKAVHSGGNQRRFSPRRRCSPKSRSMVLFDADIGGNPKKLILSLHGCLECRHFNAIIS
jgi:hypothetical protein